MQRLNVLALLVAVAAFALTILHDTPDATAAAAADKDPGRGRYSFEIVQGFPSGPSSAARESEVFLVDTQTGQTWHMVPSEEHPSNRKWQALPIPTF